MRSYSKVRIKIIVIFSIFIYKEGSEMSIEKRIKQFEESLLYNTQFKNEGYLKGSIYDRMKYYRASSISVAVINNYEIEWAKGYGLKEKWTDKFVDENTLFQAASMSKSVFAVAVMILVERGILDLDEDINTYLTSWNVPDNGSWQPKITFRQILSHTAGVTVHGFDGYNINGEIPSIVQILNGEYPANSDPIKVNIIPGLQYRYSGGGYTIAQQAVMDILKKPFPEIMKELVLEPLGMKNSTYEQPLPNNLISKVAKGYFYDGDMVDGGYHAYPEMAAAGLWTTPSDLARFGLELQLILKGEENRILSYKSMEEMLRQHGDVSMGLGFHLCGKDHCLRFAHSGCNQGFESDMVFYKENGKGIIVMTNAQDSDLLIEEIERAAAYVYDWKGFIPEEKPIMELSESEIEAYLGKYMSDANIAMDIENKGSTLVIVPKGQSPIELYRKSQNEFLAKKVNTEIEFVVDENGNINGLNICQNESKLFFERKS